MATVQPPINRRQKGLQAREIVREGVLAGWTPERIRAGLQKKLSQDGPDARLSFNRACVREFGAEWGTETFRLRVFEAQLESQIAAARAAGQGGTAARLLALKGDLLGALRQRAPNQEANRKPDLYALPGALASRASEVASSERAPTASERAAMVAGGFVPPAEIRPGEDAELARLRELTAHQAAKRALAKTTPGAKS